jgi:hypothetical protein
LRVVGSSVAKSWSLGEDVGTGHLVEQGALAGVRVADEGDHGGLLLVAASAVELPVAVHLLELGLEVRDPLAGLTAVGLQLGLARPAQPHATRLHTASTAGLAGEVGPHPGQAGQAVFELGELDLEPALVRLGTAGEDVEDEGRPVDDLDVEGLLEVTKLGGRELVVADDHLGLE